VAELNIALLQIAADGDNQDANLVRGDAACRSARELGADIALFPEMWSNGYSFARGARHDDRWRAPGKWEPGEVQLDDDELIALARYRSQATPVNGPFVTHFRNLATQLDMAIAITYLEATPSGARDSVSVIDRHGNIILTYAKVHTCAFDLPEVALVPGDEFPVASLDAAQGPVRVGAMICYDREFPESARVLMVNGAEIILTPNACGLDAWRLAMFSTRAIENAVGVAMANYPRPKFNGRSCAYHPMLFDKGGGDAHDNLVISAGEEEEIVLARFDLDALREYRSRETFGNAFRRPSRYAALTSRSVKGPSDQVYDRDGRASPLG
jgi:N-carbamoylputrescine amidase